MKRDILEGPAGLLYGHRGDVDIEEGFLRSCLESGFQGDEEPDVRDGWGGRMRGGWWRAW